jgi:hypothetical protein
MSTFFFVLGISVLLVLSAALGAFLMLVYVVNQLKGPY